MTEIIQIQDLSQKNDLIKFYEIGQHLRTEFPWQETKYLEHCFEESDRSIVAFVIDSGEACGRIAAYYQPSDKEIGYIGWYECSDDKEISTQLINAACSWLKENNCGKVIGPINGSTWQSYRFNLISSNPLFPGEPYQPMYYVDQWKAMGFVNEVIYNTDVPELTPDPIYTIEYLNSEFEKIGLRIINFPEAQGLDLGRKLYEFYHLCFKNNPLFTPLDFESYQEITEKATQAVDFNCSFLILDSKENPVGVYLSFKDIYGDKDKNLYIKTIAAHPDWRNHRISQKVINHILLKSLEYDYSEVVFALMYAGNISAIKSNSLFGGKTLRKYALLSKEL